jgi:WD40 repeat protein
VYSPHGDQIASGSDDQTVRLWDVTLGQCLTVVQGFSGRIISLAWKEIAHRPYWVTGCGDKSVLAWQVIEEQGRYQVRLSWSSTPGRLNLTDTTIQGVQGLSQVNQKL